MTNQRRAVFAGLGIGAAIGVAAGRAGRLAARVILTRAPAGDLVQPPAVHHMRARRLNRRAAHAARDQIDALGGHGLSVARKVQLEKS